MLVYLFFFVSYLFVMTIMMSPHAEVKLYSEVIRRKAKDTCDMETGKGYNG